MTKTSRAALFLALLVLAGCGGGGGSPSAVAPVAGGPTVAGSPTVAGKLMLTFAQAGPAVLARKPKFVSPGAISAGVSVNGGAVTFFDVSSTSSLCTSPQGSARSCTLQINAPVGPQVSFAVQLFPAAAGAGTLLGSGSNSAAVVAGTPFQVSVGINPQIAAGTVAITGSSFSLGTAASGTATFTFLDPAGQQITGSGNVPNFLNPVLLTSSDPRVTFSPSTLTTPGQTTTVAYDGSAAVASVITLTAAVGGMTLGTQTIAIPGLVPTRVNLGVVASVGTIDPEQLVVGTDGNLWIAMFQNNDITRIVPSTGVRTNFPSGFGGGSRPYGVAIGGDGFLYYSNNLASGCVARAMDITPATAGTLQGPQITLSGVGGCVIKDLAADSQGNIWFYNSGTNNLGYIDMTPGHAVHTFSTGLTANAFGGGRAGITLGSDNNIWFTEPNVSKIGRVTTPANGVAGTITEFPTPTAAARPIGIAAGPDGNLYFVEFNTNCYARITPAGVITEYPNTVNNAIFANMVTIAAGPDGNMWIPQGGGAVKFAPSNPAVAGTQFFTDNAQTDMHFVVKHPTNGQLYFTALGSAGGGGFTPTADSVVGFFPR
jgi:streptogramin lyase